MNYPTQQQAWGVQPHAHPSYPLRPTVYDAVNALPPVLRQVVLGVQAQSGAPLEVVLLNTLCLASFAVSTHVDVRALSGDTMPLTLHGHVSSPSCSGKSTAFRSLFKPIKAAMRLYGLGEHFEDATPRALTGDLGKSNGLGLLALEEGGTYYKKPLGKDFHLMIELFDGIIPHVSRVGLDSSATDIPTGARFAVIINTPPGPQERWLAKHKDAALDSGGLARTFMVRSSLSPVNVAAPPYSSEDEWRTWGNRIDVCFKGDLENLEYSRQGGRFVLDLLPEARVLLRQISNHYRQVTVVEGLPEGAAAHARRQPELILRLTGVMHAFQGFNGGIALETIERALPIAEFLADHWRAIVFPPPPVQQALIDADILEMRMRRSGTPMLQSDMLAMAPNLGWSKAQMSEAIRFLCGGGRAQVVPRISKGRRYIVVELLGPRPFLPGSA